MSAAEHDAALGLLSHLPQLVASALAAELVSAPFDVSVLAGQGLRDMTRIAESDPDLWADICMANADQLAPLLAGIGSRMAELASALRGPDGRAAVTEAVAAGQRGRGRLGATHGRPVIPVDVVTVLLSDRPGELARIFTALGDAGVNVDDMRIDHAPGEPVGVLELVVPDGTGVSAVAALHQWTSQVASSTSR
jgi:prephenate dehydrogenase